MARSRLFYLLISLALVITVVGGFMVSGVSAQDATPSPTTAPTTTPTDTATPTPTLIPELKLKCDVPSYSDNSGVTFNYNVELTYSGNDTSTVNLSTVNPTGWNSTITYSSKQVSSIPIGPLSYGSPDSKTLYVTLTPNTGNTPDPGEYKLTLKATSGQYVASIDLTAIVKAKFSYSMVTPDYKLNMTAAAGKANHFTIELQNTGSAPLEDISFSASKPSDWTVTFSPDKVTSLAAGQTQQEDVVITPPEGKTVAGDYSITLRSSNAQVSSSMDVRVTVETSSIWGVVSIVIIVVVIAGLAVLFLRLGRR
jgi:uncharacterized membrane protein